MLGLRSQPARVRLILLVSAAHLLIGAIAAVVFRFTGDWAWFTFYFQHQGSFFLVVFSALEFLLAWSAFRGFSRGDYLRPAWFLIAVAAASRMVGFVFSEFLGRLSFANPSRILPYALDPAVAASFRELGLMIGGPVALTMLCLGLLVVRSAYKRHGLLARLKLVDSCFLAIVLVFTVREMWDAIRYTVAQGGTFGFSKVLSFSTEPLLSILLYAALVVRRSSLSMAGGLIARCWGAYCLAVFFSVGGNIGVWATVYGHVPWFFQIPVWYIWFFASTAFTLGPAYQVEAMRRAYARPSHAAA